MKTLKKNLCLVLAMVMVFGLCTISASAKLEYADNDDISYAEAVDVLSGLGILQGSASGFRPTATITRAEAAKVLAYIMIGNSTQADALKASAAPFTDVPVEHWASGYIAYCNSRGIILGVGDGSYRPNSNVTNIQFALMLLRALGYGTQGEYNTSDWTVKVAADAIRLGVFDDNIAGANTNAATREACALYAFNVIAKQRNDNPKQWGLKKVTYSALAGGYVANGAFSSITTGGNVDANKKSTFADDFGLQSRDVGMDAFGRQVGHCWVQTIGNSTKVITGDYEDSGKQIALYTTGVTGKDIYNLIVDSFGKSVYDDWFDSGDLAIYRNSADSVPSISGTTDFNKTNVKKTVTNTLAGTGNGVQTYIYAELNGQGKLTDVNVVIIDTYMVRVNVVTKGTDKRDPDTTVTALSTINKKDTTTSISGGYATDEFDKGDYVLVTVADGKIQSMEAVDVKETEVTRFNQDGSSISIVADGTTYAPAANCATDSTKVKPANTLTKTVVDGKTHKVYVDNYGYVIAVGDVEAASEYVFVARVGNMTGHSSDFDDENIGVQVYYADGTSKVLPLKTDEAIDGVSKSGANYTLTELSGVVDNIYKLVMKSGKAVLVPKDATAGSELETKAADSNGAGNKQVKKGLPSTVVATGVAGAKVDNSTVFFYVKATDGSGTDTYYKYSNADFKVTPYIGINSVPANKDGSDSGAGAKADKCLVTGTGENAKIAAVLVKDSLAGDVTDTVYMLTGDHKVDRNNWTVTYEAYVNGELQPIVVSYDDEGKKNDGVATFTAAGVVKKFVTLDASGDPVTTKTALAGPAGSAIDKMYYVSDTTISNAADITEYELTTGGKTYSVDGVKVIDLTGNGITTLDLLKDAVANKTTVKVGVQANENMAVVCLYVTTVTA